MDQGSRRATDEEVDTWKTDGWVLLEGLVSTDEIDGVLQDVYESVPSNDDYHHDPEGETERRRGRPVKPPEVFVWPDDGPGFRPEQQAWADIFPFRGSGALNRLCVHPSVVDFAERALETPDIRLYQIHLSAKYGGLTNYEQPMHTDRNHSWLPALGAPPWWNLEGFLYLSDVTESENPTRMVSTARLGGGVAQHPCPHARTCAGHLCGRTARSGAAGLLSRLPLRCLSPRGGLRITGHGSLRPRAGLQVRRPGLDRL